MTRDHYIISLNTYLAVGAVLLVLTAVTVGVSFLQLGGWNAVVAIGVASLKAALVALVFMHLLWDKKVFLIAFLTAVLFLGVFIGITMFDTLRRGDIDPLSGGPINKNASMYNRDVTDSIPDAAVKDSIKTVEDTAR